MRFFIKSLFVFSSPILIWIVLVAFIDPYNYLRNDLNNIENQSKLDISAKINRPLFQLIGYKNHATPGILLGDSRANSLKIDIIQNYSKNKFTNLAYGGGSLQEVINSFWLLSEDNTLKDVYIGINFSIYNQLYNRDRVTEAKSIMENFFSYAFSTYTFESTYLILRSIITGKEIKIGIPDTSKEKFWIYQLDVSAKQHYLKYEYPSNYFRDLVEISKYCNKHGINLVLFIPPTHTDLQNKVKEYNLQNDEIKFKNDLKKIADLYDFDYPSELTMNKDNFRDPYHFTDSIGKIVVKELFSCGTGKYVNFTKCTTYSKIIPNKTFCN